MTLRDHEADVEEVSDDADPQQIGQHKIRPQRLLRGHDGSAKPDRIDGNLNRDGDDQGDPGCEPERQKDARQRRRDDDLADPIRRRKPQRAVRIDELLKKVGLPNHAGKYPAEMSGGMQQRLQIARCLAQEPKALLMDEPFGALDAMTRQGLQDEVLSLVLASEATVIFVTHDLEEAIYLGDRVIGLLPHPGRIGIELNIDLPRPRDQLRTRENPEFLRLRRQLFDFIKASET